MVTYSGQESHQKNFGHARSIGVGSSPSRSFYVKRRVADIGVEPCPKFFHQIITDLLKTNGKNFRKILKTVSDL